MLLSWLGKEIWKWKLSRCRAYGISCACVQPGKSLLAQKRTTYASNCIGHVHVCIHICNLMAAAHCFRSFWSRIRDVSDDDDDRARGILFSANPTTTSTIQCVRAIERRYKPPWTENYMFVCGAIGATDTANYYTTNSVAAQLSRSHYLYMRESNYTKMSTKAGSQRARARKFYVFILGTRKKLLMRRTQIING